MDMTEYKDIVVYIETADKSPVKVGLEMLSPARKIAEKKGGKVRAVLIGDGIRTAAQKAAESGADEVILIESPEYEIFHLDRFANVMESVIKEVKPYAVFVGGTQDGKDLAPKLAARLKTGCASEDKGCGQRNFRDSQSRRCPSHRLRRKGNGQQGKL